MQVDVVTRREDERALGVVTGPLELGVTPLLDPVDLRDVQDIEFSRRHWCRPSAVRDLSSLAIRPVGRIGRPLSGGIRFRVRKRSMNRRARSASRGIEANSSGAGLRAMRYR